MPTLLPITLDDHPALARLFAQSVRALGPEYYNPAQVEQWARGADHPGFIEELDRGWVAWQAGIPCGFVTLSHDGHVGLLYVAAGRGRQGIGRALLQHAMGVARAEGQPRLETEASLFSLGLFMSQGFKLVTLERVWRNGVPFLRHRLCCLLSSPGSSLQ